MGIFQKLFRFLMPPKQSAPSATQAPPAQPVRENAVYLTKTVTFGLRSSRQEGEDSSVVFVDEIRGIRRQLVDAKGNICSFPGIVREDFWVSQTAANYLKPQVRFRSSFEKREPGWIFLWQIQPDGMYWADEDGFGAEDDPEITLYTYVDTDGNFSGPFRIYQMGETGYAMDRFTCRHAESMEQMLLAARDEKEYRDCPDDLFPQLLGARTRYSGDRFYQLRDRAEALAYWEDPVLSRDLLALCRAMLESGKSLWSMVGRDSDRIKGCMTLFSLLTGEPVFRQMLDRFFDGKADAYTEQNLK